MTSFSQQTLEKEAEQIQILQRLTWILGLCIFSAILIWTGLWAYPRLFPKAYLTVEAIWEQPERWADQRVTIRGWADLRAQHPSFECEPGFCMCYGLQKDLFLTVGDNSRRAIQVEDFKCSSYSCADHCEPFDPRLAQALELVGTVRVYQSDTIQYCYWLRYGRSGENGDIKTNQLILKATCNNANPLVQRVWRPLEARLARPVYVISLEDIDMRASYGLDVDGSDDLALMQRFDLRPAESR